MTPRWVKDPPTKPGLYWARTGDEMMNVKTVQLIPDVPSGMYYTMLQDYIFRWWSEPIHAPEPPAYDHGEWMARKEEER